MIDNYDSFTYNLVQLLAAAGAEVQVVRNDAHSVDALLKRKPRGIVISPGPGRPEDAGVSVGLFASGTATPILGVCLGHQALGSAFGGEVGRAPRLMHGKTSPIHHGGRGLFAGLPNPFAAARYHSLEVRRGSLPAVLEADAWTDEGTLMAMHHRELPYFGVQFHPESILSPHGPRVLANFLAQCEAPSEAPLEGVAR